MNPVQEALFDLRPEFKNTDKLDLRVMVWSNPLVVDKIGKSFHYWKDSGFIFTKNLLKSLPENYRFYWVIPDKLQDKDVSWFKEANKNIELIFYPYSTSIHQNRYEFYGDVLKKAFPYTKDVDVILNNQPEIAANLRVWAQNQRRDDPLIFSFFHWIDCEKSRKFGEALGGYSSRQYDGAHASDMNFFHSPYAIDLFIEQQRKEFVNVIDADKCGLFNPPATIFGTDPFPITSVSGDKKIILFNHRLNGTTNWKMVIEVMRDLYKERQDFLLWITDDSKIQQTAYLNTLPFVHVEQVPPQYYGYLMSIAHFGICAHKGYSTWNMALIDAFANGCYMVAPLSEDDECYYSMLGNKFEGYHDPDDPAELFHLVDGLLNLPHEILQERARNVIKTAPAFDSICLAEIATDIEISIRGLVSGNKPAKYEEVVKMINLSSGLRKKDIVNGLWSFHVNSNFQRIRWSLLADGVRDDTSQSEPTYYKKD